MRPSAYALTPETPLSLTDFTTTQTPEGRRRRRAAIERKRRQRGTRLRRPRPLKRRLPTQQLNACNTHWPGGFLHIGGGTPLPPGWAHTSFSGGRPTNPKCFPPKPGELERLQGGGDLFTAQREARTLQAKLAAEQEAEERKARWREYFKRPLPTGALSLRAIEQACGKKPGPWACFSRWPGGWLPFDHPDVQAHPDVWKGPTPYGKYLPACFGYKVDPFEAAGQWIIRRITRAPDVPVTQPAGPSAPLVPNAPAPAPQPPGGPAPGGGDPMLCCVRKPFGYAIGEEICDTQSAQQAAGRYGIWPWV